MKNDIVSGLNDKQKEAVLCADGPLLILAGAGSGKTKTLTHRIAHIVKEKKISPYNILAVTFTNKAAKEMKSRIAKLLKLSDNFGSFETNLPWMGTFHSICVRILREHAGELGYKTSFAIYDGDDQLTAVKKIMKEHHIDPKQYHPQAVRSHISGAKNELIDAKHYQEMAHINDFSAMVSLVYIDYQKLLKDNNAMDFDDLIMNTVMLLEKYPEIRREYQEKFQYILIDEYQDTNQAQYTLVMLLTNQKNNICVVGDDAQSIYSWRGATIRNILEFEKDFKNTKVIKLEQNYRSTKNILAAADQVIAKNSGQKKKKLWTENPQGEKLTIYQAQNELDEARFVAEEILKIKENNELDLKDFAILYRTNAQSRTIEEMLLKYNIHYRIVGGLKFYERKEIKDVLAYLKVIVNPTDILSLSRIINTPPRGITKNTINSLEVIAREYSMNIWEVISKIANDNNGIRELAENHINARAIKSLIAFFNFITEWQGKMTKNNPSEFLVEIINKSGYRDWLNDKSIEGETRLENLQELLTVLEKYNNFEAEEGIRLFLEEVALITDIDNFDENENVATLMTLHSAKGLEFPVVFMVGMEENLFPHARSIMEAAEMEEERRLCYVGITRAKKFLYLTYAQLRNIFGNTQINPPSRFLADIPGELIREVGESKKKTSILKNPTLGIRSNKMGQKIVLDEDWGIFKSGDIVTHPKFGRGRIVQIQGGIIKVGFESGGIKSLAAAIAPLKKIDNDE